MSKDDVKKLDKITAEEAADELTTEELDNVNGGRIRFKSKSWWDRMKNNNKKSETGGATSNGNGASGGW